MTMVVANGTMNQKDSLMILQMMMTAVRYIEKLPIDLSLASLSSWLIHPKSDNPIKTEDKIS